MTELDMMLAWFTQPMTITAGIMLVIGGFFYWLGSHNNHVPVALPAAPTAEEIKKAQQERDMARRKIARNNITAVVYTALMKAYKENKRNKGVGLTATEAYSQGCQLFTQLRVPDAIVNLRHDLGISTEPKVDAPPASPKPEQGTEEPIPVPSKEDEMARVKARMKAHRALKAAA